MEKVKSVSIVILSIFLIISTIVIYFGYREINNFKESLSYNDSQIKQLNTKLGIAESKLLSEQEISKKYKSEIEKFPDKLKKIIKDYDLKLASRDVSIAKLKNKLNGGTTTVVINTPEVKPNSSEIDKPSVESISYDWKDTSGRFHLYDPDIFIPNNEEFSSEQYLAIKGWVFTGKNGKLQIKKIEISEVSKGDIDKDGKQLYEKIPNSNVELVDSSFEYIDVGKKEEKKFSDILTLRTIATFDTNLQPGLGIEIINIGKLIDYLNLGLNAELSADLTDPLKGSLSNSRIGVGVNYQFIPPILDTNIGVGIGISTPLNDFTGRWIITGDAIFYLTN